MKAFLHNIIRRAGQLCLQYKEQLNELTITYKTPKDLVSNADRAVEEFLITEIRKQYPDHAILGEESGEIKGGRYRWVIDPIDGTTSFLHDQPYFSVSIAVFNNGRAEMAAVYAPVFNELYFAEKGQGAFRNDRPIHVSSRGLIEESVVATGFACIRAGWTENNLPLFSAVLPRARGVRRYGSAAIDLCYVASGRLDGFWELNLAEYDIAGGSLILREAGGRISDFSGETSGLPGEMMATNGRIHEELRTLLQSARKNGAKHSHRGEDE